MKRFFISSCGHFFAIVYNDDPTTLLAYYDDYLGISQHNAEPQFISLQGNTLVALVKDYCVNHTEETFSEVSSMPAKWIQILDDDGIEI